MLRILILLILCSCSGYRFQQQENPLSQYGIQSLSVPLFYNYSNMSEVQAPFTKETYRLLTGFTGLKIYQGYNPNSDAVLIGIVKSPEKVTDTVRDASIRLAQDAAPNKIGKTRKEFYIPGTSDVQLYLHVIVIKRPSEEELALLKSGIGDQIKTTSKIIFNDVIPLRSQFTREYLDNSGTEVVGTQNSGVQRKLITSLAEQAAINIRDMVFYAF